MILAWKVCVTSVLLMMAYQDIRSRTISLWLFLALLCLGFFRFEFIALNWVEALFSASFLLICSIVVWLYFKLRRPNQNLLDTIGLGDILFLLLTCLFLCFPTFIYWFNISLLLSLILHFSLKNFVSNHSELIPLAGYQAISLIPLIIFDLQCLQ